MLHGWKALGVAAGLGLSAGTGLAQRPPYQPATRAAQTNQASPASAAPAPPVAEIHVDERCRILPKSGILPSGKKAKPWTDASVCRLENVFDTEHRVQTVVGSQLERSDVEIYEQQYVLGNPSGQPEVFIIEQPAAKGWTIEGDPPPFRVVGGESFYRAWVQPGETVRLHVGMRKVTPLKPKALKVAMQTAAPPPNPPPLAGSIRAPENGIAATPPSLPQSFGGVGPQ
jgi:hypothetical protein